ncbi:MAG: response regulator transcription factor [Campylobacteraceae bacterium]|jgi:DNA-binding response OmpR family regulator|nr:response regulator transcription factor [Campylobacteraceae bacterium]
MSDIVVIIEDEQDLLELMEFHLLKAGFDTVGFLSVKNVEKFLSEEECAVMIVDRNLKDAEGSEFVEYLRKKGVNIPAIFVTAKDKDKDVEEGFLRGGDDYLKKPFNMNELILRVKALRERTKGESRVVSFKDITLNLKSREAFISGKKTELTKLEFDLLAAFIKNKNSVLNRDFLLESVWQSDELFQEKSVNVAISRLVKKIDPDKEKRYIKPVWGVGYILC